MFSILQIISFGCLTPTAPLVRLSYEDTFITVWETPPPGTATSQTQHARTPVTASCQCLLSQVVKPVSEATVRPVTPAHSQPVSRWLAGRSAAGRGCAPLCPHLLGRRGFSVRRGGSLVPSWSRSGVAAYAGQPSSLLLLFLNLGKCPVPNSSHRHLTYERGCQPRTSRIHKTPLAGPASTPPQRSLCVCA